MRDGTSQTFPSPALIGRDDVILMPHIGASTDEAEDNCAIMAADQLRDFLENGNMRNSAHTPRPELERVRGCWLVCQQRQRPQDTGSVLAIPPMKTSTH